MKTQHEVLIKYLKNHPKGITSMKAFWLWRFTRLGARVHELRKKGYHIITIMEDNTFRPGKHARYVLLEKQPLGI